MKTIKNENKLKQKKDSNIGAGCFFTNKGIPFAKGILLGLSFVVVLIGIQSLVAVWTHPTAPPPGGVVPTLITEDPIFIHGDNVGIGDITPDSKLDVEGGDIRISTTGKGLIFPDGTQQTTAAGLLSCTIVRDNPYAYKHSIKATCPGGKLVTGGGCGFHFAVANILANSPFADGWHCTARRAGDRPAVDWASAICCAIQ